MEDKWRTTYSERPWTSGGGIDFSLYGGHSKRDVVDTIERVEYVHPLLSRFHLHFQVPPEKESEAR